MLDLQSLAVGFWELFVVSDFEHVRGDLVTEESAQLFCCGVRVLHRVVQEGSRNRRNINYAGLACKNVGEC